MQSNLTAHLVGSVQRIGGNRRLLATAGAAILAIAAGTGAGIWLNTEHGGGRHEQSQEAASAAVRPALDLHGAFTVYLVGSQAEAAGLQHELTRFSTKIAGDTAPPNEAIFVAGSPQSTAETRRALKNLLLEYGGGNVRVQDLRHPTVESSSAPAPAPQTFTVYLVGSRTEADALRQEIAWQAYKLDGTTSPANEAVLPAGTAQERAEAWLYIKTLTLDLSPQHVRVADLRRR
ncbi:MAG TPA: hypothetical protein VKV26_14100 [Dehalococcoidia bacterium]|nr:hypothetical protein [Dehalococcoidia bacterium]